MVVKVISCTLDYGMWLRAQDYLDGKEKTWRSILEKGINVVTSPEQEIKLREEINILNEKMALKQRQLSLLLKHKQDDELRLKREEQLNKSKKTERLMKGLKMNNPLRNIK